MKLVDAPVSGGVKRASNGTLTVWKNKFFLYQNNPFLLFTVISLNFIFLFQIMASGTDEDLKSTGLVLSGTMLIV